VPEHQSKESPIREQALSASVDAKGDVTVPTSEDSKGDFAAAIVATIGQPLLVLDGDLKVEMANQAFLEQFHVVPQETVGRQLYELGNGQWNIPDLRRLLEEVLSRHERVQDYRVVHDFERIGRKTVLLNAARLSRPGAPDCILLAITDVAEREQLLFDLEGRREFAEKLIDSVREGLVVLGWDLRVRSANLSFYQTFRVERSETEGRLIYELGNGQWNIPRLRRLLEDILPQETRFEDFELEHEFEHIGRRIMLLNAARLDYEHLILLSIRDVTEQRRADAQRDALTGELQHRVKNILNNVRAIASQTRRGIRTLDDFMNAFEARLGALARAQDLMVRGPLDKVQLVDLVRFELEAGGGQEGSSFTVQGPSVRLSPRDAQAMAMTIHELTTNAVKYGAWSVDSGHVEVAWRTEQRDAHTHLWLRWRERGRQLQDTAPAKGFGARVIEHSLPYILGGTSRLTFHPDGVECVMEFPVPGD
jgi:two-component sensor histidine kinase/PAS domain-containing protein